MLSHDKTTSNKYQWKKKKERCYTAILAQDIDFKLVDVWVYLQVPKIPSIFTSQRHHFFHCLENFGSLSLPT